MSCAPGGSVSHAQPSAQAVETQRICNGEYPANTVILNVYDIVGANSVLHSMGMGVHHTGVEVFGTEYAFGRCKDGTGVFSLSPKSCPGHVYRESIVVGTTTLSDKDISALVASLSKKTEWLGTSYHILRRNCNIFSEFFCVSVVTSARTMEGTYSPSRHGGGGGGHRDPKAASDSSLYTNSPHGKENGSIDHKRRGGGGNLDGLAHRDPPLGDTAAAKSSKTKVNSTNSRAEDAAASSSSSGSQSSSSVMPKLGPLIPDWTNRLARVADTLLPDMLINKIERDDRQAQGM